MSKENGFVDVSTIEKCQELIAHQVVKIAELEEQLKNAIVPKFKIGQEVWLIFRHQVRKFKIHYIKWDSNFILVYGLEGYDYVFQKWEDALFTTKEEAQAKLEELQGENNVSSSF